MLCPSGFVLQSDASKCVLHLDRHIFKGQPIGVALSDPSGRKPAGGQKSTTFNGDRSGGMFQPRSYNAQAAEGSVEPYRYVCACVSVCGLMFAFILQIWKFLATTFGQTISFWLIVHVMECSEVFGLEDCILHLFACGSCLHLCADVTMFCVALLCAE